MDFGITLQHNQFLLPINIQTYSSIYQSTRIVFKKRSTKLADGRVAQEVEHLPTKRVHLPQKKERSIKSSPAVAFLLGLIDLTILATSSPHILSAIQVNQTSIVTVSIRTLLTRIPTINMLQIQWSFSKLFQQHRWTGYFLKMSSLRFNYTTGLPNTT